MKISARNFFAAAVFLTLTFAGCAAEDSGAQSQIVLGTVCSINLYDSSQTELYAKMFGRLRELDAVFNNYSESSEISLVNREAALRAVPVGRDFYTVLKSALDFARLTGGAFDPTVGPLVRLWGFGKTPRVPSEKELKEARALVGWNYVALEEAGADGGIAETGGVGGGIAEAGADGGIAETGLVEGGIAEAGRVEAGTDCAGFVRFTKAGVVLDLGAIAKGYAADELVRILQKQKVKRASISLGGNVYVYGKKKDGSLWNVAIRNPFDPKTNSFALKTKDATVVTSGGYERFFEQDGKTYSHILNPATGFPAESGLVSVTIVSGSSMTADALSTSVFVLGMQDIEHLQKSALTGGFECLCIDTEGNAFATKGLKGFLLPLDGKDIEYF